MRPFVDETGKQVKLGDYFGKHPAILALVYYTCPDALLGGDGRADRARWRW